MSTIERMEARAEKRRECVTLGGLYPVASEAYLHRGERAKPTGEKRPPKSGEWYLSGAIIEAYRAPNDLSTPYLIARLVRVVVETTTREVAP